MKKIAPLFLVPFVTQHGKEYCGYVKIEYSMFF